MKVVHSNFIRKNFREPQPLKSRRVFTTKTSGSSGSNRVHLNQEAMFGIVSSIYLLKCFFRY